jgi:hypothetical protein
MVKGSSDQYSAGEQGLGYFYQPRLALLRLLQLPESASVLIEGDDDLEFVDQAGKKSLGSLKHKAEGDRVSNLSIDFWKSARIWLARYVRDGRQAANHRFFLFTTSTVSSSSFLRHLLDGASPTEEMSIAQQATEALAKTASDTLKGISEELDTLNDVEKEDFFSRIAIFHNGPRIQDLPALIKDRFRSVRREHRDAVYERLEGWWHDAVVKQMTDDQAEPLGGFEVSDKLSAIAEEYQADNLPITHRKAMPPGGVDADTDSRLFVRQLREIGVSSDRIRSAILDYYRAFEQRSQWAREALLVSGEVEEYEDRLVGEWARYRDVVFESLDEDSAEKLLASAGRELYLWAEMKSGNESNLRIRKQVTEPYVLRGGFHILANFGPPPKVYWHPRFLERLGSALGASN